MVYIEVKRERKTYDKEYVPYKLSDRWVQVSGYKNAITDGKHYIIHQSSNGKHQIVVLGGDLRPLKTGTKEFDDETKAYSSALSLAYRFDKEELDKYSKSPSEKHIQGIKNKSAKIIKGLFFD